MHRHPLECRKSLTRNVRKGDWHSVCFVSLMRINSLACFRNLILAAAVGGLAAVTRADIIIDFTGNTGYGATEGWTYVGQTFTAPVGATSLESFEFNTATRNEDDPAVLSIYDWTGSAISGPALYTEDVTLSASGGLVGSTDIDISVTAGSEYIAALDLEGNGSDSVLFGGADGYWPAGSGTWGYVLGDLSGNYSLWAGAYTTAFTADFGTLPVNGVPDEASTLALLAACAAGALLVRRRPDLLRR